MPILPSHVTDAVLTHLGSSIDAKLGLVNLDYNFSQRADAGVRIFTLGDFRDESFALRI